MIETRDQFKQVIVNLRRGFLPPLSPNIGTRHHVADLLEALRETAVAAHHFVAVGYAKPNEAWRQPLIDALKAIPPRLLEEKP